MKATMKVIINPSFNHLSEWIENIPSSFNQLGDLFYNQRNTIRIATAPDGTKICIKRYRQPIFINRIIYSLFRQPKAQRAYQNAFILQSKNINTPTPIAYIICKKNGLIGYSYLLTEHSPLKHCMTEFGECNMTGNEYILKSFAEFTAQLHEKEILHLDYSPGNILFDIQNHTVTFSIIDINRMTFAPVDMQSGCKNLCRLWGSSEMLRFIAHHYAIARNFDSAKCEQLTLDYWHRFWEKRKYKQHMFSNYD